MVSPGGVISLWVDRAAWETYGPHVGVNFQISSDSIPEPAPFLLVGVGLCALALVRRKG